MHVADGKIAKTVFTEVFEPLFCRPSSNKRLKVGHEGLEHRCDHPQVGEVQEDRGDKGPLHQQIPRAPWAEGLGYPLPKLLTITLRVLGRDPAPATVEDPGQEQQTGVMVRPIHTSARGSMAKQWIQ